MNKIHLPLQVSQWKPHFDHLLVVLQTVISKAGAHQNKLDVLKTEITMFVTEFKNKTQDLTTHEANLCRKFIQTTVVLFGYISRYHFDHWLITFLESSQNASLDECMKVWDLYASIANRLNIFVFTNNQTLFYAHAMDLKLIAKSIKNNMKDFPPNIVPFVRKKIKIISETLTINSPDIRSDCAFITTRSDYVIGERIGSGGFSVVYEAVYKKTGEKVALKELTAENFGYRAVVDLRRELNTICILSHPNIIKLIGVTLTPPFCIATELMTKGTLYDYIHSPKCSPTKLMKYALETARGIEYMHANGLIHRDIKSPNVLISKDDRAVLSDFGLSRYISSEMSYEIGTIQWMAPEVMKSTGTTYTIAADVYAFGIMLWEMAAKSIPYSELTFLQIAFFVNDGGRPEIPKETPESMTRLIKRCWHQNPSCRPSMSQVRALLETGKVSFDGTNQKKVEKFIKATMTEHRTAIKSMLSSSNRLSTYIPPNGFRR
jgi:hypothetical protein